MVKKLHVIVNPASGSREAERYYDKEVLPCIQHLAPNTEVVKHVTRSEGDASKIAEQVLKESEADQEINILALGGDGTTHEIVNGLVHEGEHGACNVSNIVNLALVPTGTANALYASLYANTETAADDNLKSVKALLAGDKEALPIALSLVTQSFEGQHTSLIAHLITSHALHASILADSEALRAEHPGIERFKMAFAKNMTNWVPAKLKLRPLQSGTYEGKVLQYSPKKGHFEPVEEEDVEMSDLFSYFACLTTDRLEPAFVPAPYSGPFCKEESMKRPSDAVDILLFRPLRDPTLANVNDKGTKYWLGEESEETRKQVAESHLVQISTLMYQEGKHIDLTYGHDENLQSKGDGQPVCEYYRCSGYEWEPLESDSRRVCIDGSVLNADHVHVRVLSCEEGAGRVRVYH